MIKLPHLCKIDPFNRCDMSTSGPSSSFSCNVSTLFANNQYAPPGAAMRRCAKPMPCRIQMHAELIPLRLGTRRGHYAPRCGPPGDPACRSNPRAIYKTWAPSWLCRRGAVRLTCVSSETNQYVFAGGAPDRRAGDAPRRSRLRAVHIVFENGALVSARCSFSLLAR